jgi:mRNA-degrading endonuclease toxin of MazEF toxin-antitoxin module
MSKEFDRWNSKKKQINSRADEILFHDREIWWCSLGVNVGSEQDGVSGNFERPVLIIKKFNRSVLWVVPLTRTIKPGNPNYFVLEDKENSKSAAVLSQLRLISSNRLIRKIETLNDQQFEPLVQSIKRLLPGS